MTDKEMLDWLERAVAERGGGMAHFDLGAPYSQHYLTPVVRLFTVPSQYVHAPTLREAIEAAAKQARERLERFL